jgi:spermidine/putrescine transport system substrate-binding protein
MNHDDVAARRILNALRCGQLSRREAFKALTTAGLSLAAMRVLGGSAWADAAGSASGPGGIPLARPNRPVTLPVFQDPIKNGLKPETGGTFNIFNYADYVDQKLVDAFAKKYDVDVRVTTFDSMDQAITKLSAKMVRNMDVMTVISSRLGQTVAGKLVQPINKDYIPNLKQNVWPQFQSPFYDVGAQYGVPYTIYTTGIGWRSDKVAEDIHKMDNPWSIFWQAEKYKGYVAVLDDSREALAMAMLYRGQYDINTEDPAIIDKALQDLLELVHICNVKVNITSYQTLPEGSCWLAHSWSGNLLSGVFAYMPKGGDPTTLQYWCPPVGKGPIQNDMWVVCASSTKPVLAHLWLNFIIDEDNAYHNFVDFNGYQPPINAITPESLVSSKLIPDNLKTAIMTPAQLSADSLQEGALTDGGLKRWQSDYARFTSGG